MSTFIADSPAPPDPPERIVGVAVDVFGRPMNLPGTDQKKLQKANIEWSKYERKRAAWRKRIQRLERKMHKELLWKCENEPTRALAAIEACCAEAQIWLD